MNKVHGSTKNPCGYTFIAGRILLLMAPSHWDAICLEYKCRTFTPLPPRVYTTRKDPCFPKRAKPRDFLAVWRLRKLTNVLRSVGKANWFRWGASLNTKGQSLIELIRAFPGMIAFWASL